MGKMGKQGIALVATLLIAVAVSIIVFGTAFTTIIDKAISGNQRGSTDAYYIAKAGIDKYKTVAFQTYRYYLDHIEDYNDELASGNPTCGNFLSIGLDLNRNGQLNDPEDLIDGKTVGPFVEGNGSYTVKFDVAGEFIVLTSIAKVGRSRSTAQILVEPSNSGALSYAIFAGDGQQNKFINGGADIYGSVYIVGNDPNETVIDSNGNFGMHNYYNTSTLRGMIANNGSNVDVADFLKLNALEQKDLCGTLRVNKGKVKVGGSTSLGDASAPSGFKGNMAGIHVGTDYASSVSVTGGSDVYADLKTGIDIAGLDFPVLDTDPNGKTYCDKERSTTKTWRECLREDAENRSLDADEPDRRGLVVTQPLPSNWAVPPYSVSGMPSNCSSTMAAATTSVTTRYGNGRNAVTVTEPVVNFADKNVNCVGYDSLGRKVGFSYTYDASNKKGELEVYGLVNFRAMNLNFKQNVAVRFKNKAGFFVEADRTGPYPKGGNVTIDGDLLPSGSFPDQDVLGIIADRKFEMTGANQNQQVAPNQVAAGVFYAGELAIVPKDATVFGSLITPKFCTTSNCNAGQKANFVEVPGLEYNLAPGFSQLENAAIPSFRIASFERR